MIITKITRKLTERTKRSFWGRIKYMTLIWKMWRLVVKLHKLQKIYADREIRDLEKTSFVLIGGRTYVARDNLCIKKMTYAVIMGSEENFKKAKRDNPNDVQEIIETCIGKGFIKENKENKRLISLLPEGIKFRYFSYFLKYAIEEMNVIWKYIIIPLLTFALGIVAKIIYEKI